MSASRRASWKPVVCALLLVAVAMPGCVPLPFRVTPGAGGQVVDASSGQPIADALVVVRYDARYGELLPDRELIGHREVRTDSDGRFRLAGSARAGLTAWPHASTEVRVVGVMKDGYRCARPIGAAERVTIRLEPAHDLDDRRASCRSVAAKPDETPDYHAAWRALYPRETTMAEREMQRELGRVLEARAAFGFGANCSGPAVDLALSPDGGRVAVTLEERGARRVEVVDLDRGVRSLGAVEDAAPASSRRLAWNAAGELLFWEPARALERSTSASRVSLANGTETLWRPAQPPASPAATPRSATGPAPLQPADLNDEGDARWMGRSFRLERRVDPETGLGLEMLRITSADGELREVPLPGESCGPPGQFGRPHFRIDARGERGLDLRFVDGGCRAVAIDLRDGRVERVDASRAAARCAETRRVPLDLFRRAMRGYAEEVESALSAAQGDPGTAFALTLEPGRPIELHARSYLGEPLRLVVGSFPVQTPLRRIEITSVAGAGVPVPADPRRGARSEPSRLEPL